MPLLYRCWFDSRPPAIIPSSLLLPTTPRRRLLYAFSPPLHPALRTRPQTIAANFQTNFPAPPPPPRMCRNTHASGINSVHSRCKFVSSSISCVMRECFWADEWGVIDIESQRVPLCSAMHLPEASRCSYCDLLASKCIMFSVCCSSDSRQATSAGLWMLLSGPWALWWLLQRIYLFIYLFLVGRGGGEKSLCFIFSRETLHRRAAHSASKHVPIAWKWEENGQQDSSQVFRNKKCRSKSKKKKNSKKKQI